MKETVNTQFKHRTRIIAVVVAMLSPLAFVIHALATLQLQPNEHYERYAEIQSTSYITLSSLRGAILDRNLKPLAKSYRVNDVYAEAGDLASVRVTSASLAPYIGLEPDAIESLIRRRYQSDVVLAAGITEEQRAAVMEREIPGVSIRKGEAGYDVVVALAEIDSIRSTAVQVGRALHRRSEALIKTLRDAARGRVLLGRNVGNEICRDIHALRLPGITFDSVSRRSYPNGSLACHVLGFTGKGDEGLEGLERSENARIRGISASIRVSRDRLGRVILDQDFTQYIPNGADIVLTLDEYLQTVADSLLAERCGKTNAAGGMLLAADPNTGEILALANYPAYDPNRFGAYAEQGYLNRAVAAIYEPGSVMKPITMALALEAGVVTPETVIFCENGRYRIGGRVIGDDTHSFGDLSCSDIIVRSSNIGITKVAQLMGPEALHHGLARFGYGSRTGIDLPGELPGLFPPAHRWSGSTIATVSYGQGGNSITAVQLLQSYIILANGGYLVTPHVVLADRNPLDDSLHYREYAPARRVLDARAAEQVRKMLWLVTEDPHGTGEKARVPGYRVAGKTGTARVPNEGSLGYAYGERIASFAGFVPAEKPRLVILAIVDRPREGRYGGGVAGPLFSDFAERALRYLNVPPDDPTVLVQAEPLPVSEDAVPVVMEALRPVLPETLSPAAMLNANRPAPAPPVHLEEAPRVDFKRLSPQQIEQIIHSRRLKPGEDVDAWIRGET